ncbi:MAG: CvpA family protein [Pirellulaceae bacterium]
MVWTTLILVFIGVVAITWFMGFSGTLITFINMLMGGLVASSYYPTAGYQLLIFKPEYKFFANFLAFWGLFFATVLVLRIATDMLFKYQFKANKATELTGRSLMALGNGALMMCLVAFSLHLAPLTPTEFRRDRPEIGPDIVWANCVRLWSLNALSNSRGTEYFAKDMIDGASGTYFQDASQNKRPFIPRGLYDPAVNRRDDIQRYPTMLFSPE